MLIGWRGEVGGGGGGWGGEGGGGDWQTVSDISLFFSKKIVLGNVLNFFLLIFKFGISRVK